MGWEYVPEKWRKKFKVDQKVWYLDHIRYEIIEGEFVKHCPHEHDNLDTVRIKHHRYSMDMTDRVLEDWVFTNKAAAERCLKKYVIGEIRYKEKELKELKAKLK